MLTIYRMQAERVVVEHIEAGATLPVDMLWVDLSNPTDSEEKLVEAHFGIDVPTRQEIRTIEVLSRFTEQMGTLFMTATVISQSDTKQPVSDPITFILTQEVVITCRYSSPTAFETFADYIARHPEIFCTPERIFLGLVQTVIQRLADLLDRIGLDLDRYSQEIFHQDTIKSDQLQMLMGKIGRSGELLTRINESQHSLSRLIAFSDQSYEFSFAKETKARLKGLTRDLGAVHGYAAGLTQDVNFLLNASLGLISIQQNQIIKIFSVAAVIFLPPTLVASIYGMNFHFMPELSWQYGYPFGLCIMVISAVIPFLYFKRKGWL